MALIAAVASVPAVPPPVAAVTAWFPVPAKRPLVVGAVDCTKLKFDALWKEMPVLLSPVSRAETFVMPAAANWLLILVTAEPRVRPVTAVRVIWAALVPLLIVKISEPVRAGVKAWVRLYCD